MTKYRLRPIEAIQITPELAIQCLIDHLPGPFGLSFSGSCHPAHRTVDVVWVRLNVNKRADLYDWIIQDAQGNLRVCKPDVFMANYESIE